MNIDWKIIALAGVLWYGYTNKDTLKIDIPDLSGLENLLHGTASQVEQTTAPDLSKIITDKQDALKIAGVLDGIASVVEGGFQNGTLKSSADILNIFKGGNNIAFGGTHVSQKYPMWTNTYMTFVGLGTADKVIALTPGDAASVQFVSNFTSKHRELAKAARNAAL